MNDERRYTDEELAEILERATAERPSTGSEVSPTVANGSGLTLAEIEEIAQEVGITPERIAEAARSLDRAQPAARVERFLGATRSVSRTLRIDRELTDAEWAQLVADLRGTFNAEGKVEGHGPFRSWRNSNLQIRVEPDGAGHVVRMSTRKGNVTQFSMMGSVFTLLGAYNGLGALLGFGDTTLASAVLLTGMGVGLLGWVRATLPGWAQLRGDQMDALADRIRLMLRD